MLHSTSQFLIPFRIKGPVSPPTRTYFRQTSLHSLSCKFLISIIYRQTGNFTLWGQGKDPPPWWHSMEGRRQEIPFLITVDPKHYKLLTPIVTHYQKRELKILLTLFSPVFQVLLEVSISRKNIPIRTQEKKITFFTVKDTPSLIKSTSKSRFVDVVS